MKYYIVTTLCFLVSCYANDLPANKTKRTVDPHLQQYGTRPVLLYQQENQENVPLIPVTIKPIFDPEVPKQVAAQQVLYEFQQTPTNAVSNVHVNQYYQPVQREGQFYQAKNENPVTGSETVVTPVQHSSLVRHGQNYGQVQFHPHHIQNHQYVPGKYLYVNGKIMYQPNQANVQKPFSYMSYTHPQVHTQKFMPAPVMVPPMRFRQFSPPDPSQFQPITKPVGVPQVVEEQKEVEEEKDNEEVEEEEEDEENGNYEESDDEDEEQYGRYHFDDDEHYEDDEEDNDRGSSRQVVKKHKKSSKPTKYNKSSNYKYKENYSSHSKHEGGKKSKKTEKTPKTNKKSGKYERLEGRQSQNIPVVHKQKIFKEKWYVTKSTDDSKL